MSLSISTSEIASVSSFDAGKIKWRSAGALFALLFLLLALEFILRLLPVIDGMLHMDPIAAGKSVRRTPGQSYTWSLGWDLRHVVHGKINAAGFVSPYPYLPAQPAVALLGDSFAEGIMLDHAESLTGRLSHLLGASRPIYNFGTSGASLPHYVGLAREVQQQYQFSSAVVIVSPGDYIEGFNAQQGLYRWTDDPSMGLVALTPLSNPGLIMRIARASALFRYARYHLKLTPSTLLLSPRQETCRQASITRTDKLRLAQYVRDLPNALALPAHRIVIVFAGSTDYVYAQIDGQKVPAACKGTDALALQELRRLSKQQGMRVLLADQVLEQHYRQHRQRLDLKPADGHWNAVATAALAESIAALLEQSDEQAFPSTPIRFPWK
jgi:hypothetical protein